MPKQPSKLAIIQQHLKMEKKPHSEGNEIKKLESMARAERKKMNKK